MSAVRRTDASMGSGRTSAESKSTTVEMGQSVANGTPKRQPKVLMQTTKPAA
jgi:hypothetical protein